MAYAIEKYFNKKLSRCFYNYKNLKGMVSILLTKLFSYIYIYEIMHFEMPMAERAFLSDHQHKEELNELMKKRKLSIELVLDATDFQYGNYFSIKFIDPQTSCSKIIRFVEQSGSEGVYIPENIHNQKFKDFIANKSTAKFLQRILFLMALDLNDLV